MTITIPKIKPRPALADDFIAAAPDSAIVPATTPIRTSPLKAKRGRCRSQVSVVLADELILRIDEAAARNFMSRSAFITMAINRFIGTTKEEEANS